MRGEQAELHLFPSLKIELRCIFMHRKITQNVGLCLLFQEQVLGSRHGSTAQGPGPARLRVGVPRVGAVLVARPAPGTCVPRPRCIHFLTESPPEPCEQKPPSTLQPSPPF